MADDATSTLLSYPLMADGNDINNWINRLNEEFFEQFETNCCGISLKTSITGSSITQLGGTSLLNGIIDIRPQFTFTGICTLILDFDIQAPTLDVARYWVNWWPVAGDSGGAVQFNIRRNGVLGDAEATLFNNAPGVYLITVDGLTVTASQL